MDVLGRVREFVYDKFKVEAGEGTDLAEFVQDSLDRVEMLMELEEMFGVQLSEEDVLGVVNVGDLVRVISRRVK
jgi:acyl carrier protein